MDVQRTTDATAEPVSAVELRAMLRMSDASEDALLDLFLQSARQTVEGLIRKSILPVTWTVRFDRDELATVAGRYRFPLPNGPVTSVTSVTVIDTDDASTVLSASDYAIVGGDHPAVLVADEVITSLREDDCVRVVYIAALAASEETVPAGLKLAIMRIAGTNAEGRTDVDALDDAQTRRALQPWMPGPRIG